MNVNKFTKLIFLIFTVNTYSVAQNNNGFHVKIHMEDPKNCEILVSERVPNMDRWFVDTLQLKKGRASYQGKLKEPHFTSFLLNSKDNDFIGTFSVFLDNSNNVVIKGKNPKDIKVSGSAAHDEYCRIEKGGENIFKKYASLKYELSKYNKNKIKQDSIRTLINNEYEKLFNYITTRPGYATSEVIPYYISEYFIGDTQKLEKALNMLSSSLNNNVYVKNCREELDRQKKTAIGQPAYDFNLKDVDGKHYRLSDYRGKYVLIEFSASWCGWCKKEIPFLQKVYNEHQNNPHFAMLTINLDDTREKWVNDVKHENLPWPVISDLKGFKGEVTNAYNVHGIPAIFLINPEGQIIRKNLRGEEMIETVRQYLDNTFSFQIDGKINGFDEGWAYLSVLNESNKTIDSCIVRNGAYHLKGNLKKPCKGLIFIQSDDKQHSTMQNIYIQPGTMGIQSEKVNQFYHSTYTNAPIQTELDSLYAHLKQIPEYKEFNRLSSEIQKEYMQKSNASKELKDKQNKSIYQAINQLFLSDSLTKSEALSSIVWDYSGLLSLAQLKEFYQKFSPEIQDSYYLSLIHNYLEKENNLANGKSAPNFVAQDIQGKTYTLTDFKGKYIFLEFSASWCGWCKKEIPYIRKAYEKLKDKNIVFVTLMMDNKKDLWKKEVSKYNITWLTLSDLKGIRDSQIAQDYNVSGIPASFVISPEGKIVNRDLRGDEVLNTLKQYAR